MAKRIGRPPLPTHLGQRFGMLTVIRQGPSKPKKGVCWWCECDCGTLCILVPNFDLHSGNSKSCGCTKRRHGLYRTSEYKCWINIRSRCENKNDPCYSYYGARGIQVCDAWQSFDQFLADMGFKPSRRCSIERLDVNGNYTPENCTWATPQEQARNKRTSIWIEHNGERLHLKDWEARTGVNADVLGRRLKNGWSVERTLTTPGGKKPPPRRRP